MAYQVMSILSTFDNFGRHVLDGAAEGVGPLVDVVGRKGAAEAEVGEDDVAFLVQENVLELDVSIYHTVLQNLIINIDFHVLVEK